MNLTSALGDLRRRLRLGPPAADGGAPSVALSLSPSAGGGSQSFGRVLADWLPAHGIQVTFDVRSRYSLLLVFAQHADPRLVRRVKARGVKILHRLDERLDPTASVERRAKHALIGTLNGLADGTIFQSRFARDSMAAVCPCPRTWVIHNGVDPKLFSPGGPTVELTGRPSVLHVSWSVGESKRLDRIGELLGVLPAEGRVYLAGRHAEAGLPFLGDPRVTVLGVKSRDEVPALMRSADLLFFPSECDPCPNTVIEAMACGLPILYHPSGGTVELIGDAGVPISGQLAEDVAAVLATAPLLRERGLARAVELSAERVVGRYAQVILDLLGRQAACSNG